MNTTHTTSILVKFAVICAIVLGTGYYFIPELAAMNDKIGAIMSTSAEKSNDDVAVTLSVTRSKGLNTTHVSYGVHTYVPAPRPMHGKSWNKTLRVKRGDTVWVEAIQPYDHPEAVDCFIHRNNEQLSHDATSMIGDSAMCRATIL